MRMTSMEEMVDAEPTATDDILSFRVSLMTIFRSGLLDMLDVDLVNSRRLMRGWAWPGRTSRTDSWPMVRMVLLRKFEAAKGESERLDPSS